MLGQDVALACLSTSEGDTNTLAPSERMAVSAAVEHRRREFAAGRSAARSAMRYLGRGEAAIPANPDRSPCWPPGLVGSISHCRTTCVAVVALDRSWQSVGVDVEHDQGMPFELWGSICGPDELRRIRQMPVSIQGRWVTRVFCAKEAYYKWVYPRIQTILDFHDVVIEMDPILEDTRFTVRPLKHVAQKATPPSIEGTLTVAQGLLLCLMIH